MRDLIFSVLFVCMIPAALALGASGVMLWIWVALIAPVSYLMGFAKGFSFNKVAALAAVIGILADKSKKRPYVDTHIFLLLMLLLQCTISDYFSLTDISRAADLYDRITKAIILCLIMLPVIRDRLRIHGVVLTICLGMGMHGTSEAMKYIITAGGHQIEPPSFFGDNNSFGLALLMFLPLLAYLGNYLAQPIARNVARFGLALNLIAVVATNSRGALVGMGAIGLMLLAQSKRKLHVLAVMAVVGIGLVFFTPASWRERMDTISDAQSDSTFMGRVRSWKMNTLVALDRPFFGGGFSSMEDQRVFDIYVNRFSSLDFIPTEDPAGPLAAHSIYFEILGDTGFVGLGLFLAIMATGFNNLRVIRRLTVNRPEWAWATDLAYALRLTLVAYAVSGAALSMAYFELYYVFTTLISVLRKHVETEVNAPKPQIRDNTRAQAQAALVSSMNGESPSARRRKRADAMPRV